MFRGMFRKLSRVRFGLCVEVLLVLRLLRGCWLVLPISSAVSEGCCWWLGAILDRKRLQRLHVAGKLLSKQQVQDNMTNQLFKCKNARYNHESKHCHIQQEIMNNCAVSEYVSGYVSNSCVPL